MSILARIYKHTLGRILPQNPEHVDEQPVSRKRKYDESDSHEASRRYQLYEEENGIITKRRRVTEHAFAPIVNGEEFESTLIEAPAAPCMTANNAEKIRVLKPPPAISLGPTIYNQPTNTNLHRDSMDVDSFSQTSFNTQLSPNKTNTPTVYDDDMERARRHAAATCLPENSGLWEESERQLFFHISYRGFEPLLPISFFKDFKTLPLTVFATGADEAPLIQAYQSKKDFRAMKELGKLHFLGRNIRDKVLALPGTKREDIIDRAIKQYFRWALSDAGIKISQTSGRRESMPIHVQIKLKPEQSKLQGLAELKAKMHALRAQHFRARNIHESIERDAGDAATPGSEGATQVAESSDDDVPVIYGIMIMSSIIALFTLNSRIPSPRNREGSVGLNDSNAADEGDLEDDSASDPRYISDFDFSDQTKDVWNALVVAILAMQIRSDMLALRGSTSDDVENLCAGIEESSVIDDDPDA